MRVIVTGGAGFIGSALVRHLIAAGYHILNLDKLTYSSTRTSLPNVAVDGRYQFVQADVCDAALVCKVFADYDPDGVIHLAAESHVDRSIDDPKAFIDTNVFGTFTMLQAARDQFLRLGAERRERFRFHHVSTDEVYGSLGATGMFTEDNAYRPRSPYAASKAASDHLAIAWFHTYGLPVVLSNCSNNYGPYQFPEKLIPLCIIKALANEPIPIYGKGENIRDWLFVDDHVRALQLVFERGKVGAKYNIGGNAERRNIEVVRSLCYVLDQFRPRKDGTSYCNLITFVADRPGHDQRYAIDTTKTRRELGWQPGRTFEEGIAATVAWYLDNEAWWQDIRAIRYSGERLGLQTTHSA